MKKKKIITIIMIIMILISISNIVFGGFAEKLQNDDEYSKTTAVVEKIEQVLGIVQIIGAGMAVIMITSIAIKYMVSSVNERAEIKKHLVVYVVGAIFLFGATGLLEIVKVFAEKAGE